VTLFRTVPCSMLDRESSLEAGRFFVAERGVSNHFACLPRARRAPVAAFGPAVGGAFALRLRDCADVLRRFGDSLLTARTKRRVIASISRFSWGLPWS
jgi:hypothetical protein